MLKEPEMENAVTRAFPQEILKPESGPKGWETSKGGGGHCSYQACFPKILFLLLFLP